MARTENSQGFVVLLFDSGKKAGTERLHFLADFGCLLHQKLETNQRQRLIQSANDGPNVQTCRSSFRQQAGVYGRLEQWQLSEDALDIEAVANLEQAIGNSIPVTQQLVVA